MTDQVKLYRSYARFVKRLLLLGGIWPMIEKESSYFYRRLPIFAVSSGVMMLFGVCRFCQDNIGNLSVFTKGLSLIGSFSLISLKALMFIIYRKQLCELNDILDPMFEKTLENPRLRPILLSLLNLFRFLSYVFYLLIMGIVTLYVCTPLIFIGYEAIKDIYPRRYGLPYPTSFPWIDGTPGIYYHIQYIFETQYKQLATYRRYASFIKRLLFYSGLWPVENKKSSYFYRHIPILAIVYAALLFYGCVRFCKDNLNDVKAFTKGLSPLGSMVVVIIKVLMFFLYQEEIRELHLNLESIFEEVIEKTYCRPVLFEMLNIFKRPAYIFYYLTIITVIMLTCMPFLLIIYEAIKNINPRHYILPYPATFPWIDGSFGIKYELQYLHEIQVGWFIIFVTSGVDTAYGFYIFQMVGILRFMSLECEKIGKSSDEFDIILLRNCIEKEILLLRCRDIIQNVYGPVVLNLIVSSVVVLCGLIFQVLQQMVPASKNSTDEKCSSNIGTETDCTYIVYGILKFCLENLDDIKVLTKGLSLLASFTLVTVKALMFFIHRKELRELNLNLEEMFEEVLGKAHYRPVVLSLLNLFKRPAYMVYYLTMFIILSYICKPLILMVYQNTKNINPKHYALPYPATYPWIDGTPNIIYQVQFILQIIFGWFVVFVTSSVDAIYGFYIFQITGILRAMSFECEKLGKSSKELNVILRNCIKKHILLLRCRDIIQKVYGPLMLGLIVSSVIVLCALIFQMFQV
ncbi:hypothetical protein M0804_015352 [Polistes exclamans]|nr:hypothetical protein M0804_015352 [Polistes exclamans]